MSSADLNHGVGGGESSGQAPQQRRRLSRPDLGGISAIFNPRKQLRRSSTAISQLFGASPRPPSVVITDDNSSDNFDYGGYGPPPVNVYGGHYYLQHRGSSGDMTGGLQGPSSSSVNLPSPGAHGFHHHTSRNIPHLSALGPSFSGSLASMQGGQGVLASSVPLLADVQHQMNVGLDGGSGTPVGASHYPPHHPSHQSNNNNNAAAAANNNNNQANLKPIAKTLATIKRAIFSKTARKLCCGIILSLIVGVCWTVMIHSIKRACITTHLFPVDRVMVLPPDGADPVGPSDSAYNSQNAADPYNGDRRKPPSSGSSGGARGSGHVYYPGFGHYNITNGLDAISPQTTAATTISKTWEAQHVYDAPFFTAWILTFCTVLFYPFHQMTVRFCSCMGRKGPKSMSRAVSDAIQGFRERGMTLFQFMGRCTALCFMWLFTNYLLISSMRNLRATESLSLFATTTSFAYLLSWVILHQQFVGLRILAVILSNMGIALFAYMDGQTHKSKTVGGVLFGALAACCSAVFKVLLKKMFGVGATISQQVALIFSVMGLISILLLWPIFLTLYFTGVETILWPFVPWDFIVFAVLAFLLVSMLDNFGVTCTFEFFITIGLLMAIPFTAAIDHHIYSQLFGGMCLAGIITISIGFVVVLLPENWPDYITRLIRYLAQLKHHSRWGRNRRGGSSQNEPIDTRTGHIRSHLRSPSGRRMSLLDLGLRKHFALAATTLVTTPSPTGQPFVLLRRKNTLQEFHPLDHEQEHEILTPLLEEIPHYC